METSIIPRETEKSLSRLHYRLGKIVEGARSAMARGHIAGRESQSMQDLHWTANLCLDLLEEFEEIRPQACPDIRDHALRRRIDEFIEKLR